MTWFADPNAGVRLPESEAVDHTMSRCPMCFSRDATVVATFLPTVPFSPWRVAACRDCNQMYTCPRPKRLDWARLYPPDYPPHQIPRKRPRWDSQWRVRLERWLLACYRGYSESKHHSSKTQFFAVLFAPLLSRRLDPFILPAHGQKRLLDIGCGSGRYLSRMQALGWRVLGIDASPAAASRSETESRVPVIADVFPSEKLSSESFDLITMWQVLEHLDRPRMALRAVRRLLRPSGRLVLTVPNQDSWAAKRFGPAWVGLDLPRHLSHFTNASVIAMLTCEGFHVVHQTTLGHSGWIRHSARRAQRIGEPVGACRFASRFVSRLASAWAVARNAGESIYVVAERRDRM